LTSNLQFGDQSTQTNGAAVCMYLGSSFELPRSMYW